MTGTVFIGGSRRLSRLTSEVTKRLDTIVERNLQVVIGDANGADKAVQAYLTSRSYRNVRVFCASSMCRNNLGGWSVEEVQAQAPRGTAAFYASKDQAMALEAKFGLMLWDGKSIGTLLNVSRLLKQHKKVAFYVAPSERFWEFRSETEWHRFLDSNARGSLLQRLESRGATEMAEATNLRMAL